LNRFNVAYFYYGNFVIASVQDNTFCRIIYSCYLSVEYLAIRAANGCWVIGFQNDKSSNCLDFHFLTPIKTRKIYFMDQRITFSFCWGIFDFWMF